MMASAVFSMESRRLARSGEANPPPPPQPPLLPRSGLRHPAANARSALQPRLSLASSSSSSSPPSLSSAFSSSTSSSSSSLSPPSSLASSSRTPSMIRVSSPARGSRSSNSSSGVSSSSNSNRAPRARVSGESGSDGGGSGSSGTGGGGGGGISGVWASIMSLGASAFPASLAPISLAAPDGSSSSGGNRGNSRSASPRRLRRYAVVAPAGGRGTRVALSLVSSSLSTSWSSSSSPPLITGGVSVEDGIEHSALAAAAVVEVGGGDGNAGNGAAGDLGAPVAVAAAAVAMAAAAAAEAPAAAGGELEVPPGARTGAAENVSVVAAGTLMGEAGAAVAVPASVDGRKTDALKKVYLEGGSSVYTCSVCRAHLATRDHVISECFHGHGGRAFLFERCVNVTAGRPEDRRLLTGMHVVADIACSACGAELGWKYEEAAEKSQKYKEGKFILERCAVTRESSGGTDCFGSDRFGSDGFGSDRFESGRFGSDRCGSNIVGWGSENEPFADSARW